MIEFKICPHVSISLTKLTSYTHLKIRKILKEKYIHLEKSILIFFLMINVYNVN
jgi:hypothetical protein